MATATKEQIPQPQYVVRLELTDKEAETLVKILDNVGGCRNNSPRQYADSMARALKKCGVVRLEWHTFGDGINFADTK
jgi:hypothetical protein